MKFKKHVFVCTNQKPEPKKSCGAAQGAALVEEFRRELKDRGLQTQIRVQGTACLDACAFGPALVVYPEGVYYGNVQPPDVPQIVEEHLVGGHAVERLKLDF